MCCRRWLRTERRKDARKAGPRSWISAPPLFPSFRPSVLELYLRHLRRPFLGLEVLPRRAHSEDLRGEVVGEAADEAVELVHGAIVVGAGNRDAILGALELVLQSAEILARLELGIGFGNREQSAETGIQLRVRG